MLKRTLGSTPPKSLSKNRIPVYQVGSMQSLSGLHFFRPDAELENHCAREWLLYADALLARLRIPGSSRVIESN
jgi:hypothetical protein